MPKGREANASRAVPTEAAHCEPIKAIRKKPRGGLRATTRAVDYRSVQSPPPKPYRKCAEDFIRAISRHTLAKGTTIFEPTAARSATLVRSLKQAALHRRLLYRLHTHSHRYAQSQPRHRELDVDEFHYVAKLNQHILRSQTKMSSKIPERFFRARKSLAKSRKAVLKSHRATRRAQRTLVFSPRFSPAARTPAAILLYQTRIVE